MIMTTAAPSLLMRVTIVLLVLLILNHSTIVHVEAFSASFSSESREKFAPSSEQPVAGNVLILDHLNINHERGRHNWLKSFYFDFLGCAVDPKKADNLKKGQDTLWANVGAHQFHLPQGSPDAQVLDGCVTLVYPNLNGLQERYLKVKQSLRDSKFVIVKQDAERIHVIDPWGSEFCLVSAAPRNFTRDSRGTQPGGDSTEGLGMSDLLLHVSKDCNVQGIARFYEQILGAPILSDPTNESACIVSVGPQQTLTFVPTDRSDVSHGDLRDEPHKVPNGKPTFASNYGPHVSMYVADFASTYKRADALGVTYVNPRFKRRAYTLEEALDQCMFRCIDIVDPLHVDAGPILKLEHEIRSVVKTDGTKYKSCPFNDIPDCVKNS